MNDLRAAAQQALRDLEQAEATGACEYASTAALRAALAQEEQFDLRTAAQQALEALEDWDSPVALPAITALRAALAQEAEPVTFNEVDEQSRKVHAHLAKALRIPEMPWPDPHAHGHEAAARAIHTSYCAIRFELMDALARLTTLRATVAKAFAALAQQEREPVASQNTQEKCRIETVPAKGGLLSIHPPRRETEQEPVAWVDSAELKHLSDDFEPVISKRAVSEYDIPLFTHPPRREWQSLSEEEIDAVWEGAQVFNTHYDIARAVEQALKERNT